MMKINEGKAHFLVALGITAFVMLCLFQCSKAHADKYENHYDVPDIYYVTEVTEVTEVYEVSEYSTDAYTTEVTQNETADGVAAAIAVSQLNFDYDTPAFQLSAGLGNFEDNTAWAIGGAQRVGKLLINGSVTSESNKTGYGVGATMRFR